jgi:HK97 family phage portal protein
MKTWWKNMRNKTSNHSANKKSADGSWMSYHALDQPVWTPHRYNDLCEEGYIKNVIVYRCISLIARNIAGISLKIKENGSLLTDHPVLNSIKKSGAGVSILEAFSSYLLLCGNAYVSYEQDESDFGNFQVVRPDRVHIHGCKNSKKIIGYEVKDNDYKRTFPVDTNGMSHILQVTLFHPLHDFYGMSPLRSASSAIDQHNAVGAHNLSLLQNGGRPSGAFIVRPNASGTTLSEEQRAELREDLQRLYEGQGNAGRVMMLEGDFDWKEMGLSPKDLDFLSGKNVSSREIAQAFGVPPMLVGVPGDATFANYKEARFHLWEDTIIPLLDKILSSFSDWASSIYGQELEISYDKDAIPALRTKRDGLFEALKNCDFLTKNEKRKLLGFCDLQG